MCNVFTISLKKVRDEVDFFDAYKHQSFLTVDLNTLGIKVFYNVTGMIMKTWRTWWWEWSRILKVLKVASLQCLYNISKNISPDMSKVPKALLHFSNIFRKSIATASVFYCDAKYSDTLLGFSHVCRYFFLGGCGQKWIMELWNLLYLKRLNW